VKQNVRRPTNSAAVRVVDDLESGAGLAEAIERELEDIAAVAFVDQVARRAEPPLIQWLFRDFR
jgi:hypothetical protein